jgi:hypothetical protein
MSENKSQETSEEHDENIDWMDWSREQLIKHSERNKLFIDSINHSTTFEWVVKKMSGGMSGSRAEMGNEKANASLRLMARYNFLVNIILPADELDEAKAKQYLDGILELKEILTKP